LASFHICYKWILTIGWAKRNSCNLHYFHFVLRRAALLGVLRTYVPGWHVSLFQGYETESSTKALFVLLKVMVISGFTLFAHGL